MITLKASGMYELAETKHLTRLLILDGNISYAWVMAGDIGEILVASQKSHKPDRLLARGKYRIYDVADEPNLIDLVHLELSLGGRKWQGYLLPTGLPSNKNKRNRIIASKELIGNRRSTLAKSNP